MSPAEQVIGILHTEGVGVNPAVTAVPAGGWKLGLGKMVDVPDRQITLFDTGGLAPHPTLLLDYPSFQVQIRGDQNAYINTFGKAKQVKDVLLGLGPVTLGDGTRIDGIIGVGDVNYLEHDGKDRPVFTVNFRAFVEPPTNADTNRTPL
jgi:hypothetical protein